MQGHLALVLHAHLPFVRHPEHEKFLEETWLFEAITESYVPLIQIMDGWLRDEGYTDVARTLDHTELFLRASRHECSARPFLPPPVRPYWFERPR